MAGRWHILTPVTIMKKSDTTKGNMANTKSVMVDVSRMKLNGNELEKRDM